MSKIATIFILLLICSIPMENALVFPGFGSFVRVVGVVSAIFAILAVIIEKRRIVFPYFLGTVGLFVLWNIATYFWSIDIEGSKKIIFTFMQIFLFSWIVIEFGDSEKNIKNFLAAYVIGAYVSSIATIYSYMRGVGEGYYRYSAFGFNANDLSLVLALAVPIAWYLSLLHGRIFATWFFRSYVPFAFFAITLTGSRGGFVSLMVALLFLLWSYVHLSIRAKGVLAVALFFIGFWVLKLIPSYSWERLATTGGEVATGTLNYRTTIWANGIQIFFDNSLFGVGAGGFQEAVGLYIGNTHAAHNLFLSILVEVGLIGFVIFIFVLASSLNSIKKIGFLEKRFWIIMFLTWTLGVTTLSWAHKKPTWFFLSMLSAQGAICKKKTL